MYQDVIAAHSRLADLRAEASHERQARQATRVAKAKRIAEHADKTLVARAKQWTTAA